MIQLRSHIYDQKLTARHLFPAARFCRHYQLQHLNLDTYNNFFDDKEKFQLSNNDCFVLSGFFKRFKGFLNYTELCDLL